MSKSTVNLVTNFRRARYEWTFENPNLELGAAIESDVFEAGIFKWKAVLYHCQQDDGVNEMVKVLLLSCNDIAVTSDIAFRLEKEVDGERMNVHSHAQRQHKTAAPFNFIYKQPIPITDFKGFYGKEGERFGFKGKLIVTFDLKNIRAATDIERRKTGADEMVQLEVLTSKSIDEYCNTGAFGIAHSDRTRECDVSRCSLIRYWAKQWPDARYWLCKRKDGFLVEGCLSSAKLLECFEDICEEESGGLPWVTLFREEERIPETFQSVDENSLVIFCFENHAANPNSKYCGHLVLPKTMPCYELFGKIAYDMVGLRDGTEHRIYLRNGPSRLADLTCDLRTLEECHVHSGSIIELAVQENIEPIPDSPTLNRLLSGTEYRLSDLKPGFLFSNRFLIDAERVQGKRHIFFAIDTEANDERVVLKFYTSNDAYTNCLRIHKLLSPDFVCRLVHWIDEEDGLPPCLVFERGNYTLDNWMQSPQDVTTKRHVLFKILNCIYYLHSKNIVHCDIKPANFVFFIETYTWKLLDTDISILEGEPCGFQYTLRYAAPEMVKAEKRNDTLFRPQLTMDMWSFGVLAFELLTGRRFFGEGMSDDEVKDCLCGRRTLTNLDYVKEDSARSLLKHLLCPDPEKRWPAIRALDHATFSAGDSTTKKRTGTEQCMKKVEASINSNLQRTEEKVTQSITEFREDLPQVLQREVREPIVSGIREVGNSVNLIRNRIDATYEDVCQLGLLAKIEVETLKCDANSLTELKDIRDMECESPLKTADDYLPDEPIYLVRRERSHRIRVSLMHKWQNRPGNFEIKQVLLTLPGGYEKPLKTIQTMTPSKGHEVVALFPPELFEFLGPQKQFGLFEDKYVDIPVAIEVNKTDSDDEPPVLLSGRIVCLTVSSDDFRVAAARFKHYTLEKWKSYPQWIRNAARGAMAIGKCTVKGAQAASNFGGPTCAWNVCEMATLLSVFFCGYLNKGR